MYYLSLDGSVGIVATHKSVEHILRGCPINLTKDAFIRVAKDEFDQADLDLKYEHDRWHRKDRVNLRPSEGSAPGALKMNLKI